MPPLLLSQDHEKTRILANWDPSYTGENVDWYTEYINRQAPIQISWLQQPRHRESASHETLEVRGLALLAPHGAENSQWAVAPLDDGSICLWDVSAASKERGRVVNRSSSGVLSVDGKGEKSKMVSNGVVECISVNQSTNKAYIAVESCKLPSKT